MDQELESPCKRLFPLWSRPEKKHKSLNPSWYWSFVVCACVICWDLAAGQATQPQSGCSFMDDRNVLNIEVLRGAHNTPCPSATDFQVTHLIGTALSTFHICRKSLLLEMLAMIWFKIWWSLRVTLVQDRSGDRSDDGLDQHDVYTIPNNSQDWVSDTAWDNDHMWK